MTLLPSSLTFGSLIESVIATLYGQTAVQDRTTALAQDIGATDTTFTVTDAQFMKMGLIEIDSELIRVQKVDPSSGVVTLFPTGRGMRATLASPHSNGAEIRIQPIMTYSAVAREIQAELNNLYPAISWVSTFEFTSSLGPVLAYGIPADASVILDVRYKDTWGNWQRARAWEVEYNQNPTDFPTGVALRVSLPRPSTLVRVIYGKPFGPLLNMTDTLSGAGVPASVEDVLRLGATIRLLPSFDLARLSAITVPGNDAANRQPQPNTGVNVGRELARQYQMRLTQEANNFRLTYPVRVHVTR